MQTEDWMAAAQSYLARVGAAEYAAFRASKAGKRKRARFTPSQYLTDMCAALGRGNEEAFKADKMLQGYASAIRV